MNNYDYWRRKLANPQERIPVDQNDPQCGFYRTKGGNPVAIWIDNDGLNIVANGILLMPEEYETMWTHCAARPVTEDAYQHYENQGRWPDVDATLAGIGQNRMDSDLEGIIDDLAIAADDYDEITSDEQADRAQSLRARLLDRASEADKIRVAEKEPHLEAGRKVDARWMPWVKKAKTAADLIRMAIGAFETRKRAEARRIADEAERAATLGLSRPDEAPAPAPRAQVRGGAGRAASVREVTVVDTVVDWAQLAAHYANRPSVQEAILKAVAHDLRDGHEVPGITTKRVADVR